MASRKFTTVDPAVRERRLRQIYELLDSGNNKRVLQEVDRLLKKMPDITCAKVLKALALLRMGKPAECEVILDPIVKETQTDDSVIQALSICYRELDKPHMVCQVLEKASQQDKSEDVMTNMFMAYTRIGEYQKQHQTALALYKMYPKTPYFSWAIMSLYAKAVTEPDPLVQKVSLPLAERMMAKFITDNNIESEYELTLYCLILRQQRKYDKLLELLQSSFIKQSQSDVAGFYYKNKVECLNELGLHDELANFMEENLIKNPDDYKSYAEYVKSFGSNNSDRVIKFIKERITEKRGRSCLLAYLYLYQFLFDQGIKPRAEMDPISVFKTYAEDYGNKPSFFMDLCGFLSGLQKPDAKDAFLNIMKDFIHEPVDFLRPKEVQRHINFRYMSRFFSHRSNFDAEKVLNYVNNSISLYLDGNEAVANESKKGNTLDDLAVFEFITLSALTLLDSYWFGSDSWEGILKKLRDNPGKFGVTNTVRDKRDLPKGFNKLHSTDNASNDVSSDSKSGEKNDRGTDDEDKGDDPDEKLDSILNTTDALTKQMEKVSLKDYSLQDEDLPVLLTLALLEHGVSRSIKNAQLRILLSKAYIKCGAVGAGADSVIALDMKHMQWESLGYLYIWKLTTTGHMQEASRIFKLAENFYTTFQRENMEFVISAYKYGSWEKVLEFLEFRDLLLNSVQYPKLRVERHLLEYSKSVATVDDHASSGSYKSAQTLTPLEIAQRGDLTLESLSINKDFGEARDFGVLLTYSEEKVSKAAKELTHKADIHSLKLRALVAVLLDRFVMCSHEGNLTSKAEEVETELGKLAELVQYDCSTYDVDQVNQIPIDGMWSPRTHQYVKAGHADLLLNMFYLTYEFGKRSAVNVLTKCVSDLKARLENITKQVTPIWSSTSHTLLNRLAKLESFYEFVESMGFCVLLIDVCRQWVKSSSSDKTKKKKKAKEVPIDATEEAIVNCFRDLIGAFATALKSLDDTIAANPLTNNDSFPTEWESMSETWAKLVGADLCTYILPYSLPVVMKKLRLSYDRSCADLKHSIQWKKSHLDSLISNL